MKRILSILTSTYVAFACMILIGAYGVLHVEQGASGADIQTYGDALWWALNVSSVGDASFSPVTSAGRIIGAALIFLGYALFSINVAVLSAMLQHWLKKP